MKKIQLLPFLLLLISIPYNLLLAQGGADNAADVVYNDGWQTGDDGGTGFGLWTLNGSTNAGFFIGSSDINISGKSWGTFANSGEVASAIRDFDAPMAVLDAFEIAMDNGSIQNGGTVGFALQNSNGDNLMEFFFRGGESNYEINDANGVIATGTGFTNQGLTVEIGLLTTTSFNVTITPNVGSQEVITGKMLIANANQAISRLRIFNANAGGGSSFDAFFNSISHVELALPVELFGFEAVKKDNMVNLEWTTFSETNNSHFLIQKSQDSRTWEKLAIVEGKGNSNEQNYYILNDEKPAVGQNYYRLKQVDYDGSATYSDIVSVHFDQNLKIIAYPNPATNVLYVSLKEEMTGVFGIFNLQGQLVESRRIEDEASFEMNVENLPNGIYCYRLTDFSGFLIDTQKLYIQH